MEKVICQKRMGAIHLFGYQAERMDHIPAQYLVFLFIKTLPFPEIVQLIVILRVVALGPRGQHLFIFQKLLYITARIGQRFHHADLQVVIVFGILDIPDSFADMTVEVPVIAVLPGMLVDVQAHLHRIPFTLNLEKVLFRLHHHWKGKQGDENIDGDQGDRHFGLESQ